MWGSVRALARTRFLIIHPKAEVHACISERSSAPKPSRDVQRRAKQVWGWCQQEGGVLWAVSQGEIAEMLMGGGLSPEVQQLCDRRCDCPRERLLQWF